MRFTATLFLPFMFAVLLAIPASLFLGSALAQSSDPLRAEFPGNDQNTSFHNGVSSVSRVVVNFSKPVADFSRDTPSVRVEGGVVTSATRYDVSSLVGLDDDLHIFVLNATVAGPITFSLVPNQPCESGGICTDGGRQLTEVPAARVIPGAAMISFTEERYTVSDLALAEIQVSLEPEPGREVTIPLSVTYGNGVDADDVAGMPDNLSFASNETSKSFEISLVEDEFDRDRGTIFIAMGELPAGISAGEQASAELNLHGSEILSATMTVGSGEGFLGFGTFSEDEEGELTGEEFTWRGTAHAVTNILLEDGDSADSDTLSFEVSPGFAEDEDCLYLRVGDSAFSLASGRVNGRQFFWHGVDLDWETDDEVDVELRQFPPSTHVRAMDGRHNNKTHTTWGNAGTDLLRMSTVSYMDRVSEPPDWLPDARTISNEAQDQDESIPNSSMASDFLWQWGQFLDHDISLTPQASSAGALNIRVPTGDSTFDPGSSGGRTLSFTRSEFNPGTGTGADNPREQVNRLTAFIDASQVYGSDDQRARSLRANDGTGKLRTSGNGRFLMYNTLGLDNDGGSQRTDLFLAGDVRSNEQAGLTAMHTLFLREHNRLAEEIAEDHPGLIGTEIYEMARKIVGAQIQVITFNEFVPLLLGSGSIDSYEGYDPSTDPTIANEFSTAAFRVGHTLLSPDLLRITSSGTEIDVSLSDAFFSPSLIEDHGISEFLRGLSTQKAQEVDLLIVDEARNLLFREGGGRGMDLAALNIQRGRDHGIADYNSVRRAYGMDAVTSFSDVSSAEDVQEALEELYDDINDLDLWVGGLAEDHAEGAMVGETFRAIISDQLERLRDGDRFWYENDPYFVENPELMAKIRSTTLAVIIRRNTSINDEISNTVFVVPVEST